MTLAVDHVILYGQSLSLGSDPNGGSVISAPSPNHLMFNGGVRPHADTPGQTNINTPINPDQIVSFVTLAEAIAPSHLQFGETFASGIGSRLTNTTLVSATGRGAYTAQKLSRYAAGVDYNHWLNTVASVIRAKEICEANGDTYRLKAVVWKQGEADAVANTDPVTYRQTVQKLRDELFDHIETLTGVDCSQVPFFVDQVAHRLDAASYEKIAVASLELHRSGVGIRCIGPTYPLTFSAINDVHFSSVGYRLYGERIGLAINAGLCWEPCRITSVARLGNVVAMNVHVPVPPLVLDTNLVAAIANNGFAYSGCAIVSVEICPTENIVLIGLAETVGGTLRYSWKNAEVNNRGGAMVGPRGNIRDSSACVANYDGSPLYNWLCVDEWEVA